MNFVKMFFEDLYFTIKKDFKLLAVLSIPGIILAIYGFYQCGVFTPGTIIIGGAQKFIVEFFFLASVLYFLHLCGLRNKWAYSLLFFAYLIALCSDIALLMYFKERFGVKYLETLEGADYNFMSDYRVVALILFLGAYAIVPVQRWLGNISKPQALDRLIKSLILLLIFALVPFYKLLPPINAFYAKYMLPPVPVYILQGALAPKQAVITSLTPATEKLASKYDLFTPAEARNLPKFDRVILVATEALSKKFIHTYNNNLPKNASPTFDRLIASYPSATLRPSALSTLYGLSIIFTGHPNAKLSSRNSYPVSFVKVLKDNGFETTFLRGAEEEYMDENILFKEAGFETVYGASHFASMPAYKPYINWWGMTDRKLFEYAVEYLKENKDKKMLLQILTVDTHVPKGREDYLDQLYPAPPADKHYQQPNMAAAFWRYDHDLGLFIENLELNGLLDERTLLIITADHPFYSNLTFTNLVTPFREDFDFVPFILVSKKKLPALPEDAFAAQVDIAPTVLELTGFAKPRGMFGKSLFESTPRALFDVKEDYIIVKDQNGTLVTPMKSAKKNDITALVNTFLE